MSRQKKQRRVMVRWDAYRYIAARRAVLTPLMGTGWRAKNPVTTVNATLATGYRYRDRLKEYRDNGCLRLQGGAAFAFTRNCPPFGLGNASQTRRCRWSALCPFCYARDYVIAPFRKFELALYGQTSGIDGAGKTLAPRFAFHVLAFRVVRRFQSQAAAWTEPDLRKVVDAVLVDFVKLRAQIRRDYCSPVSVMLLQAYPAAVKHARELIDFAFCGVVLTGFNSPSTSLVRRADRGDFQTVMPATKKHLCDAFGRAFRYPEELVTGPAPLVLRLQEAFAGRRRFFWTAPRDPRGLTNCLVGKR